MPTILGNERPGRHRFGSRRLYCSDALKPVDSAVMGFLLNWLLWERKVKKKQDEVNKIYEEMGRNETILELAKDDPKMQEDLRTHGIKSQSRRSTLAHGPIGPAN